MPKLSEEEYNKRNKKKCCLKSKFNKSQKNEVEKRARIII